MKLKRLRLVGFKTFAEKTEIELSEGITAVVGPNGCGKSNIADALLWALGEQNPRLLRGSETRDFIFAGSEKRKPLGMAEVQIILDNSDQSLPLPCAEIAVARRIYRSGESRYTINGTVCRLKDIVDLFLDTGMGRGAYSFVGQSEIDAVLSARPEDRRELFEEAAGVQKYRARKREALRKLETCELNLTRVHDILAELERQREPLCAQAEVAERYLAIAERLRSVEVDALVADIHRCDYELYAVRRDREESIATVARLDEELAAMEREAGSVRASLSEAETEQNTASLSRQSAAAQVADIEHGMELTAERMAHIRTTAERLDAEMLELAEREQTLTQSQIRDRNALERLSADETARRNALAEARRRLKDLEEAAQRAEEVGRDHLQAQRRLLAERAAREKALASCTTRLEETRARLEERRKELGALDQASEDVARRLEAARATVQRLIERSKAAAQAHEQILSARRAAEDRKERVERELAALRRRYSERAARLQALREMQAAGEGLFQGVRAVLHAARDGALGGHFSTVADILRVPDRLRNALEAALGSAAQNVVCATAEEARRAISWLKSTRKGRATFLPLDSLDPPALLKATELRGLSGAIGIAAQLVACDPVYAPAVNLLLNRVILFEDLDSAMAAARRIRGWSRIVTLDGELLTPGGAVTGGDGPGRGPQLVRRKGEMDDLVVETGAIEQELHALERQMAECTAEVTSASARVAEAAGACAEIASQLALAEHDTQGLAREQAALEERRADLHSQIQRLTETLEALSREAAEWQSALDADTARGTTVDEAVLAAQTEAEQCTRRARDAREEVVRIQVELERIAEQIRSLRRAVQASGAALEEVHRLRTLRQQQREEMGRAATELEEVQRKLTEDLERAHRRLDECNRNYERWTAERTRRLERSFRLAGAIQEATARRSAVMAEIHDADLKIARLEVRLAQQAERLATEYGMTLEEALAAPEPPEMDRDTVQEIARLRRELRAMGNVNTGAVDEYRRLTDRYDFLSAQQADLQSACASLRETIAEIDRNTRAIFMDTFLAVEKEFQRLFSELFAGGETRLVLTQPDNILETGVEVMVRPPGKRMQDLTLLSGGERALTAVAFLFSFLAVRPSPFVVLDEVDAPLDGANVDRFVELLRRFATNTQFLVITHNPTTIESATCWYGVTMQEPGVSKVFSYRPRVGAVGEEAVVATGN